MEEQLGFQLFERGGRRVVLNAAGTALLRSVEPALAQIDDGLRAALAEEPLLGAAKLWDRWFEQLGMKVATQPVASFSDAGMMLQAAEQGMGLTLGRGLLAADALSERRLVQLAPQTQADDALYAYWIAYPR